jgi:hypothetical protein
MNLEGLLSHPIACRHKTGRLAGAALDPDHRRRFKRWTETSRPRRGRSPTLRPPATAHAARPSPEPPLAPQGVGIGSSTGVTGHSSNVDPQPAGTPTPTASHSAAGLAEEVQGLHELTSPDDSEFEAFEDQLEQQTEALPHYVSPAALQGQDTPIGAPYVLHETGITAANIVSK